jgi:3-dehydroquinate synthase
MLQVQLGGQRNYPIVIQPGGLDQLGAWAQKRVAGRTAFIITHPRLFRLYGPRAADSLKKSHFTVHTHCVPEGEKTKSLQQLESIIGVMLKKRMDRRTVIVALGGGVVGDLSGLVAATFMRGVDFIQVPTTLLAQVDSSVGGKVAVNHALGKNMIGAFYQPRLVLIDPAVLATLSARQFRAGLAEVIKSAVIADKVFFTYLEKNMAKILQKQMPVLTETIRRTCSIKANVVSQDEKEHGLRAILNYGHTLGHALEAYHHYRTYLHGEAVAIGMVAAALLAHMEGMGDKKIVLRQKKLIYQAGLPIQGKNESVEKLLNYMKVDKKSQEGKLNFVLTPQIGHARISNKLTPFSVRRAINCVVKGFAAEDI